MWKILLIIFNLIFGVFYPEVYSQEKTFDEDEAVEYEATTEAQYDPTKSDWENYCDTGSIMEIADTEWALDNAPDFHVETKEQLAGVVYYINAINTFNNPVQLTLEADIDLDGLDWVPMGYLGNNNNAFIGVVDGQGHTIKNMHIDIAYQSHCAFIGYSYDLAVRDINFEQAYVSGGSYTGIVGGEIYTTSDWINVNTSGIIDNPGYETGSIIGREAYINFRDCKTSVFYKTENGMLRPVKHYSHRYEVIAKTPITEDFTLTYEDGVITRNEIDGFMNLSWHIEKDGTILLQRLAENELTLPVEYTYSGASIWLEAYTTETYTRVSNIIEVP